jgi:hypothetical protein
LPEAFFVFNPNLHGGFMTRKEFYETIANKTGEDINTIESLGFELHIPSFVPDRKEMKRERRLKLWRQLRRDKHLATIAGRLVQS